VVEEARQRRLETTTPHTPVAEAHDSSPGGFETVVTDLLNHRDRRHPAVVEVRRSYAGG
jgi:hypothetical protein